MDFSFAGIKLQSIKCITEKFHKVKKIQSAVSVHKSTFGAVSCDAVLKIF